MIKSELELGASLYYFFKAATLNRIKIIRVENVKVSFN
jgi:hypothetical protein